METTSPKEVLHPLELAQESDSRQFCNICLVESFKYTCPRCNIRYCSINCYKSERHLQCSELFYKECVMRDLKNSERSPEDKQRMMELLQRFEAENATQLQGAESDTPSLEERLAGLDIDCTEGELVWQRLTAQEKREFNDMIKSGAAGDLLDAYTPWWEASSKVTPVESDSDITVRSRPALPTDLPLLSSTVKTVSPCVKYTVLNVLYAYAYTVRLFNGGHSELPLQSSQALLELATSLCQNVVFNSVREATGSAISLAHQNHDLFNSKEFSLFVLQDVLSIVSDQSSHDCHVIRALSDVHTLFKLAHRVVKSSKSGDGGETKNVWQARKKAFFLLVWTSENVDAMLGLKPLLGLQLGELQRELISCEEPAKSCDSHVKTLAAEHTHKLIEEL
ncbi:zinc finger HIT domain-containing protein 2-like [Halichondria panicea]|uniref:zinc finger HIT domain-containing protein 2-like n=1 Tax=Halichondria panicea TaxID=6063 RepID=UPI00312B9728